MRRANYILEQRRRHFGEADQHRWVIAVMISDEERVAIHLHQHVAIVDRRDPQREDGVVIAKSREEVAVD